MSFSLRERLHLHQKSENNNSRPFFTGRTNNGSRQPREKCRQLCKCRRCDVLADEDHSNHMSEEEYLFYKNKWWLHLNKLGSDTLPLRKGSDFKQASWWSSSKNSESFKKRQGKSWERTGRRFVNFRRWFLRIHSFCYKSCTAV